MLSSSKAIRLDQALILDPPMELHFTAPLTEMTTAYLKLTNPTDSCIYFKLKTTAPKMYLVYPNSGIIVPGKSSTVTVKMQAVDFEQCDKSKHKFMVQSLFASSGDIDLDQLFKDSLPENLMNSKLTCVFGDAPSNGSQFTTDQGGAGDAKDEIYIKSEVIAESSNVSTQAAPIVQDKEALFKAQEESRKLKMLLSELRQENSKLKEDSLRSRVAKSSGQASDASSGQQFHHSKADQGNKINVPLLVGMSIIIFIIGIYLGHK